MSAETFTLWVFTPFLLACAAGMVWMALVYPGYCERPETQGADRA